MNFTVAELAEDGTTKMVPFPSAQDATSIYWANVATQDARAMSWNEAWPLIFSVSRKLALFSAGGEKIHNFTYKEVGVAHMLMEGVCDQPGMNHFGGIVHRGNFTLSGPNRLSLTEQTRVNGSFVRAFDQKAAEFWTNNNNNNNNNNN